jgi:hypothetical protein
MSLTLAELETRFLRKINEESTNHPFGSDLTTIDGYINDAYREIAIETGVCTSQATLTTAAGTANYAISGISGIGSVNAPNIPRKNGIVYPTYYALIWIDNSTYDMQVSSSDDPTHWTIKYTYTGSPATQVQFIYLYPTPSSVISLIINYSFIPGVLSASTDIPLWSEAFGLHDLIADVAARMALKALGDVRYQAYEISSDVGVIKMKDRVIHSILNEVIDGGPRLLRVESTPYNYSGKYDYPNY